MTVVAISYMFTNLTLYYIEAPRFSINISCTTEIMVSFFF